MLRRNRVLDVGGIMILGGLKYLHGKMAAAGMGRAVFPWRNGQGDFEVVFFGDEKPMALLFGLKSKQFAFEKEVGPDYSITTFMGGQYGDLCDALGIENADPANRFSTNKFFTDFAANIPTTLHKVSEPHPVQLPSYRRVVEESDKVYFLGWLNHAGGSHVTAANLDKTKALLGRDAWERCRRSNISSRWTDDPSKERPYIKPQLIIGPKT